MGSSILSEVDDTSILRTGLPTCYWRPLNWLPASRLLRPRSGLERSDFVPWPDSAATLHLNASAIEREAAVLPRPSHGQILTLSRQPPDSRVASVAPTTLVHATAWNSPYR